MLRSAGKPKRQQEYNIQLRLLYNGGLLGCRQQQTDGLEKKQTGALIVEVSPPISGSAGALFHRRCWLKARVASCAASSHDRGLHRPSAQERRVTWPDGEE